MVRADFVVVIVVVLGWLRSGVGLEFGGVLSLEILGFEVSGIVYCGGVRD